MQGLWQQVRKGLCDSIGQLQPDQYFCVIVFGAGSILESSDGKMVRATEQAKKDAYNFIGSVQPRGATNAVAALEYAVKIRDRSGVGPSLIYFLTDGFELSEQDNSRFAHQVATMLRSFAPKTQINTIGFWPAEQDRKLLEAIAKDSGGEFVVVGDGGS
jgi:Mg-chelatase subunit ChlD